VANMPRAVRNSVLENMGGRALCGLAVESIG
jgi:hypothetical protein